MRLHSLLFKDLLTSLGWRFPVLIAWTALVGLTEGVSIILLLPLLSRVGVAAGSSQGLVTGLINKSLAFVGATEIRWQILACDCRGRGYLQRAF